METNIIKISSLLSSDIRCRDNANILKCQLPTRGNCMLDFSNVIFISRSFADELYNLVNNSSALVQTCNMCAAVQNMYNAVVSGRSKKRVRHFDSSDIYVCSDMKDLANVLLS
jgi:hypothetical protein